MFQRSRADGFTLYGPKRSRGALPRWLLLLLVGVAAGAGGLWWVQVRYLPPRLTSEDSVRLLETAGLAQRERYRLAAELAQTRLALQAAQAGQTSLQQALDSERAAALRLRGDLEALVSALPPDPRQGQVEVRAARFAVDGGKLDYKLVLTRKRSAGKPLAGEVRLVLTGSSAPRGETSVALKPIAMSLEGHKVLRGRLQLPEGFRPDRSTVRVVDAKAGTLLGTRVMVVR